MIRLQRVTRELTQEALNRVTDEQINRLNNIHPVEEKDEEDDILKKLGIGTSEDEQPSEDMWAGQSLEIQISSDNYKDEDFNYKYYEYYIDTMQIEDLTQLDWATEIIKKTGDVVYVVEKAEEVFSKKVAYERQMHYLRNK